MHIDFNQPEMFCAEPDANRLGKNIFKAQVLCW